MRVSVSFTIDCAADTAWEALHRTDTVASVYAPLLKMHSEGPVAKQLRSGDSVTVQLRLLGIIPVGRQNISVQDSIQTRGATQLRTMHDRGGAVSGPLLLARNWHHQMSIAPHAGDPDRATWTDTLQFSGPFAGLAWPVLRGTWGLRAARIKAMARDWVSNV